MAVAARSGDRGQPGEAPLAATSAGRIRGSWEDGVASFRGIPYAQAPAGELRFAPPRPAPRWEGVRDATAFGPVAPQPPANPAAPVDVMQLLTGNPLLDQGEDNCLTLNVWTPDAAPGAARPVLVWFHGSGWLSGGTAFAGYGGRNLAAAEDIVVVTANFRLGVFGFLALPGVAEGNMGFLDMIAALRWVQENIAAFGGDPARVTVGGQSGGAVASVALLTSPLAAGLFRRVFAQSGPLGLPLASPEQAAQVGERLLAVLGLEPQALRELTSDELVRGYQRFIAETGGRQVGAPAPPLHLVAGGPGLPEPVMRAVAGGAAPGVELLIGAATEEMRPFLALNSQAAALPREPVLRTLGQLRPAAGAEPAYAHYAQRRPGARPAEVLADVMTDAIVRLPAHAVAHARARTRSPAFVYEVAWRSALGACHAVDVPFLFDNLPAWRQSALFRDVDLAGVAPVGEAYRRAVGAFVRTGDPNADGVPDWPPYTEAGRSTMRFDTLTAVLDDPARQERTVWGR